MWCLWLHSPGKILDVRRTADSSTLGSLHIMWLPDLLTAPEMKPLDFSRSDSDGTRNLSCSRHKVASSLLKPSMEPKSKYWSLTTTCRFGG